MNKWQQQVYDMLRAAGRNNLPCTVPADVVHIPANMMLEADRIHWISVKERLPDIDAEVLIVTGEGLYDVAQYSGADRFWTLERNPLAWVTVADVTHWMPLPEPPKEK